ncbi:MAG: NifU family protein [Bacteroidia bacterium]
MTVEEHKQLIDKVQIALESIRPFLQRDGGDVELIDVSKEFEVSIKLTGTCASCNMSGMTMKNGIEESVKRAVPEIKNIVEAVGE